MCRMAKPSGPLVLYSIGLVAPRLAFSTILIGIQSMRMP